jgi:hypothetical protein
VVKLLFTFDRPEDFLARFVKATELSETNGEIVPRYPFISCVANLNILVCRLAEESRSFLRATQDPAIQIPKLIQCARLRSDILKLHADRERFPVGILRRF